MKELPILFNGEMVRAILEGRKTQTRRIVKPGDLAWMDEYQGLREPDNAICCPFGQPGDRLWVRETWCCVHGIPSAVGVPHPDDFVRYRADNGPGEQVITDVRAWKPSIHMPRVYSRIQLEVAGVRVERLNDISEKDALAEGIVDGYFGGNVEPGFSVDGMDIYADSAAEMFRELWESIYGLGSWAANPWVWVIEFRKI